MTRYFAKDTPLAGLERLMMSVPGFQQRGGGMAVLCRFRYRPEDVDCRYCREYAKNDCKVPACPYIPERLEAGVVGYRELAEKCFSGVGHKKLKKRIAALSARKQIPFVLEESHWFRMTERQDWRTANWQGPVCPQWLAAVYLLSSRSEIWRLVRPSVTCSAIDFSSISLKGINPADYPVYLAAKGFYNGRLLISAAELADENQVGDEALSDILNAVLIVRYGNAVMAKGANA